MTHRKIAHPEWLTRNSTESTFRMYREGKLPPAIQAFMLVTPMKHAMRAIYGRSNLAVALILLREAIVERYQAFKFDVKYRLGLIPPEDLEIDEAVSPQKGSTP